MSFFEGQLSPAWSPQHRQQQQSWDQSGVPSRSGANSAAPQQEDPTAFEHQFEEVARAQEILSKNARPFPMHGRRESLPPMQGASTFGRQFDSFDRMMPAPQRHHSVSEYDARSPSSMSSNSYQGFVANQRFGPRPSEAEQMLQAKRRAAAQRERELRNYHQEQQYNRTSSSSGAKSERAMSPGAMSEEDRRELIQRQHRALYGDNSSMYTGEAGSRTSSQDARAMTGHASPAAHEGFAYAGNAGAADASSGHAPGGIAPRERANSTSPPSAASHARGLAGFDPTSGVNAASASSPGSDSPTRAPSKGPASGSVAPIGTRPLVAQQGKRGTPPAPSPLSYGAQGSERSQSAASNPTSTLQDKGANIGWGGNNGPWGNKTQSVWS